MGDSLKELVDAARGVRHALYVHQDSDDCGEIYYAEAMEGPVEALVVALNNYQDSKACSEVDSKKRFFYVISKTIDGRIITSAARRVDGTIFNSNEIREQAAKDLNVNVNDVYIDSWVEFDCEQDYLEFHGW